jgi:hypothetical protein
MRVPTEDHEERDVHRQECDHTGEGLPEGGLDARVAGGGGGLVQARDLVVLRAGGLDGAEGAEDPLQERSHVAQGLLRRDGGVLDARHDEQHRDRHEDDHGHGGAEQRQVEPGHEGDAAEDHETVGDAADDGGARDGAQEVRVGAEPRDEVARLEPVDLGDLETHEPVDELLPDRQDDVLPGDLHEVGAERAERAADEDDGAEVEQGPGEGLVRGEGVDHVHRDERLDEAHEAAGEGERAPDDEQAEVLAGVRPQSSDRSPSGRLGFGGRGRGGGVGHPGFLT